jgi:ABC-type transport system involved in multi-copper enzyme maturation permease subunit
MHFGLGPVFIYECLANSRRRQTYALRVAGVAALLFSMWTIATSRATPVGVSSWRDYAALGESYFYVLIGVELALVMLAAPAATAGAICLDRACGTLDQILVTDLSDSEVVLGKLGARLLPVLGLVACSWPVMAISSLLGGIDPSALALAFAIIVAVGVFGCAMALALSVWARKPHEVIMAVYSCWAIILVAYPAWVGIAGSRAISGPPRWLLAANPFYLAFTPYLAPNSTGWWDHFGFFGVTSAGSLLLAWVAVWRMRAATVQAKGRVGKVPRLGLLGRLARSLPRPSLDGNPVLWREWHRSRPSAWMTILVGLTLGTTTACCIVGALAVWRDGLAAPGGGSAGESAGIWSCLLQVVIGLLMFSGLAPLSLAEERQRGSLDVLLATPLASRTIVLGKWMGTFRLVPWLALGPALVVLALATGERLARATSWNANDVWIFERLYRVGLFVATILIHGAAIASIGLLAATWIRRPARAIAVSVTLFVLVSIGWPFFIINGTSTGRPNAPVAALSPFVVTVEYVNNLDLRMRRFRDYMWSVTLWDLMVAVVVIVLLEWTVHTFDRCLGRMHERGDPLDAHPAENPPDYHAVQVGA